MANFSHVPFIVILGPLMFSLSCAKSTPFEVRMTAKGQGLVAPPIDNIESIVEENAVSE